MQSDLSEIAKEDIGTSLLSQSVISLITHRINVAQNLSLYLYNLLFSYFFASSVFSSKGKSHCFLISQFLDLFSSLLSRYR